MSISITLTGDEAEAYIEVRNKLLPFVSPRTPFSEVVNKFAKFYPVWSEAERIASALEDYSFRVLPTHLGGKWGRQISIESASRDLSLWGRELRKKLNDFFETYETTNNHDRR